MLINVLIAFAYLTLIYFGAPDWLRCRKLSREEKEDEKQKTKKVTKFIIEKYEELGSMNFHEGAVAVLFVIIVLLWFTREPGFMPGWGEQIPYVEVGDSTAAIFVVFLLFAIPKDLSVFFGGELKYKFLSLDDFYRVCICFVDTITIIA